MPWCPECQAEYRQGFTVCSDCGHELIEQAEFVEERVTEPDEWAFLVNFEDDREVVIIESLLASCGIPLHRKYKGLGGYFKILTGMSAFGVDLYVPKSQLEAAKEILNSAAEK